MSERPKVRCACVDDDAYCCWSMRYHGHAFEARTDIDDDGGPCQCVCHEHDEDDPS